VPRGRNRSQQCTDRTAAHRRTHARTHARTHTGGSAWPRRADDGLFRGLALAAGLRAEEHRRGSPRLLVSEPRHLRGACSPTARPPFPFAPCGSYLSQPSARPRIMRMTRAGGRAGGRTKQNRTHATRYQRWRRCRAQAQEAGTRWCLDTRSAASVAPRRSAQASASPTATPIAARRRPKSARRLFPGSDALGESRCFVRRVCAARVKALSGGAFVNVAWENAQMVCFGAQSRPRADCSTGRTKTGRASSPCPSASSA
jgi:hypothetical protein